MANEPGNPKDSDQDNSFDDPNAPSEGNQSNNTTDFDQPSVDQLGSSDDEQTQNAYSSKLGEDILALKSEIETQLTSELSTAANNRSLHSENGSNLVGVGITSIDAEDIALGKGGGLPGQSGLVVFTVEPMESSQLKAEISSIAGTRSIENMPITQVPVGIVEALSHRFRIRPAPGGVSVGHPKVTAGTLGCLCVGSNAPRNRRLMILSNNHVLANSNSSHLGDCISQPGTYDGGECPADQIAILERFVPIKFGTGFNYVDCATGWAWPARVRKELIYLSGGQRKFFRIGSKPLAPRINMPVGKSGRTTQLTQGRVTATNVTVNVNYGSAGVAQFRDQFAVRGLSGNFSAGGDSGSVIWHWDQGLRPVGLLFAGGGGLTFGNTMDRVVKELDINLYT